MVLYEWHNSGNSYKVRLLAHVLGFQLETQELDIFSKETWTPELASKNPFKRVPFLQVDNEVILDSNAIVLHLAGLKATPYFPNDPVLRRKILSWLFFDTGDISAGKGSFHALLFHGVRAERFAPEKAVPALVEPAIGHSNRVLDYLEETLSRSTYLVSAEPTIADFVCFVYPYLVRKTKFANLFSGRKNVNRWLDSIQRHPRFIDLVERDPIVRSR